MASGECPSLTHTHTYLLKWTRREEKVHIQGRTWAQQQKKKKSKNCKTQLKAKRIFQSSYLLHNPLCSTLTAGLSLTKLEHFQSKQHHFQFKWVGEQWTRVGCLVALISCISAIFHLKELRSDLCTFTSLPCLPRATLRRDTGPEMLVSVALLVAFSTSRF